MNLRSLWLAAALCVSPALANAAGCDDIPALLSATYPDAKLEGGNLIVPGDYARQVAVEEVACKVWPYKTELTLLAVPLKEAAPAENDLTRGDIEVIVANSATGKPVARRLEAGMADADAIQFSGITLDTARYDVTAQTRAFGVVTRQSGSSRVNPYLSQALWLYSFDGARIERLLDGLVVDELSGENDGNCTGATAQIKRSVSILPEATAGYHDLGVEETSVTSNSKESNGECVSQEMPAETTQRRLQFRNYRYRSEGEVTGLFSFIELRPSP